MSARIEIHKDDRVALSSETLLAEHAAQSGRPFDDQALSFVAYEKAQRVGYAHVQILFGRAEILRLAVEPAYQGHGHGRSLLVTVEREMRALKISEIYLSTWDFQAEYFYAKNGYCAFARLTSLNPDFPGKVWMKKAC